MPQYMLVYDNPFTHERIKMLIEAREIARTVETLEGQGAKCGYWSLEGWQRLKSAVLSGQYQFR